MTFIDKDYMRIINKGGLDCLYNFHTGDIVSASQIDNFGVNYFKDNHAIHDLKYIEESDTLERLQRMMKNFKTHQIMTKNISDKI